MGYLRPTLYIFGFLLIALALAMLPPLAVDIAVGFDDWSTFLQTAVACAALGILLVLAFQGSTSNINHRHAFFLTTFCWFLLPAFGALPFMLSSLDVSPIDALFEAYSGITTTGSTVLSGLDTMQPGILLWRSILQWIGGIGIIVMGMAILPFIQVGGLRLLKTESSDTAEKVLPKTKHVAASIFGIYLLLTVSCLICYQIGGMTGFEAVNHALTTLATGGFSTSDSSMGHFDSLWIHWTATFFMLSGALPFGLYVRSISKRRVLIFNDEQVRFFLKFLFLIVGSLTVWGIFLGEVPHAWFTYVTHVAFNTVSVITTTGYATTDYTLWGAFPTLALLAVTFSGGCTGSTSGGYKIFRTLLTVKLIRQRLFKLIHPHGVKNIKFNGRRVTDDVLLSLIGFGAFWLFSLVFFTLVLAACGLDILTSFSGAATAIANVGPGVGDVIGPAGNFSSLPEAAKFTLIVAMVMGRLEIMTAMVLLYPGFWKR